MKKNNDGAVCIMIKICDAGATGIQLVYGWPNEHSTGALAYTMNID